MFSLQNKKESFFSDVSRKEYFNYCFYSFLGSFGSFLAFRVDGLMIPEFLDFDANGAYRNAVNFAAAMAIPATGLFTIYSPQISTFIKNKDYLKDIEINSGKYTVTPTEINSEFSSGRREFLKKSGLATAAMAFPFAALPQRWRWVDKLC